MLPFYTKKEINHVITHNYIIIIIIRHGFYVWSPVESMHINIQVTSHSLDGGWNGTSHRASVLVILCWFDRQGHLHYTFSKHYTALAEISNTADTLICCDLFISRPQWPRSPEILTRNSPSSAPLQTQPPSASWPLWAAVVCLCPFAPLFLGVLVLLLYLLSCVVFCSLGKHREVLCG